MQNMMPTRRSLVQLFPGFILPANVDLTLIPPPCPPVYLVIIPGGASDPECTHVILKEKEYEQQLRKISVAEQEARNAKYDADQEIRQVRSDAQSRVSAAVAEADQRVKALEQELAMAQKEAKSLWETALS